MDYSVGSLADLITGKNTPNKKKVVHKEFSIKTESDKGKSPKVTPKKKKNMVQKETLVFSESPKKEKKKKKSPIKQEEIETSEESKQEQKKAKKRKSKNTEIDENVSAEESPKKQKKNRKRSLDISEIGELADSDAEEEITPKKQKLSPNEENAERRIKKKIKEEKQANPEYKERTVFVGNVPMSTTKKDIRKQFKKYGQIEAIRFRGIPVANPKTPKKIAAIKQEFHPDRNTVYCFIRFMDKDSAEKAEKENGALFQNHHLRVQSCKSTDKPDEAKAIFVGNLSFDAEEEELWKLFEVCGPIEYVRIIRDSFTGMARGFGYVNFKDADAVQLALEMETVTYKDRELRISLCNLNVARKNKKNNKKKQIKQAGKPKFRPRSRFGKNKTNGDENMAGNKLPETGNSEFQGAKFNDKKKKRKFNKGMMEKKKLIQKLAPKPKV